MGDFVGHPFRGNQWTSRASAGGGSAATIQRGDWYKTSHAVGSAPTPDDNPTGAFSRKGVEDLTGTESNIALNDFETARVFDATGGTVFIQAGGEHQVQFTPEQVQHLRGCVLTHNHPSSTPISDDDVALTITKGLREIRAVGTDGSLFRFGCTKAWSAMVLSGYYARVDRTRSDTRLRIARGEITVQQANDGYAEEQHNVLMGLARDYAALGVYYKRTRRADA